ncbi:MAG: phosphatase [Cyanobacteria bacterium SW_12_48_29]|jgi:protein-tyrosine phosphatase|nr:MAG: phosphatase [Cyanobacteria bacterium QS_1_48_34]PSO80996.1 MAG: phosphatase [Cyanobacteria bacterium QS_5_48_63]PSO91519.1 MAG: phosphatase [Cyanobacteria bacterium QS_3_48_167]PSO93799.1 MAG: phosphatase [Cyanobacteria bacterium QS_6_48_18]PSP04938.1 MAG: phosphatase [Cyanobacteria bacterium SW_12_48_29]PSP10217.1 MAG: phosphatase [Cyanobacteria bacterium SW_10_48_33]PSP13290.1 MAG: phosphatase [Cyanobacteria bacterium SW_11_48_12]PSP16321.1 MAG: phosphatase [Cyanobacteria bacterium
MSDRFSWILPQNLAVGSFTNSSLSVTDLSRMGITAILCLTKKKERAVPAEILNRFVWERVAIPDGFRGGTPSTEQIARALAVLSCWHQQGHVVYVHCLAGVGRSPSVCAAYLTYTQGMNLEEALSLVKERHPYAKPDPRQIKIMQKFFTQQGLTV